MRQSPPVSAAYDFTRSGAGGYFIKPSNLFTYVDASSTLKNLHATIEEVAEVKLSGNLTVSRRVYDKREDINFFGCTGEQEWDIRSAAVYANIYAENAYEYLKTISFSTDRYEYWFGPHTPPRQALVQIHFEMISQSKFENFIYQCGHWDCTSDSDGFVSACIIQP